MNSCSLQFAESAKKIENKPVINEVLSEQAMITRYQKEIKDLKKQLEEVRKSNFLTPFHPFPSSGVFCVGVFVAEKKMKTPDCSSGTTETVRYGAHGRASEEERLASGVAGSVHQV